MSSKFILNGISTIILVLATALSSLILTRVLGPVLWGQFSQITWLVSLLSLVFSFGLTYTANRYLAYYSNSETDAHRSILILYLLIIQIIIAIVMCSLIILSSDLILELLGWQLSETYIKIASLNIFSLTFLNILIAMVLGLQELTKYLVVAISTGLSAILAALLTAYLHRIEIYFYIISITQLLVGFTLIGKLLIEEMGKIPKPRFILNYPWREILKYTFIVYLALVFDQIVWQRSEMYFLGKLLDSSYSGFYSLGYTITLYVIGTVPIAITGLLTPIFTSTSTSSKKKLLVVFSEINAYLIILITPLSLGLFVVAPNLINLLFGEAFAPTIAVIRILTVSTSLGVFTKPVASLMHAMNYPQILLASSIIVAPINLILGFILVPKYQANGAAYANLISQFLAGLTMILFSIRKIHIEYELVTIWKSLFSGLTCSLVAWSVSGLFGNTIVGLLFSIISGGITYTCILFLLREKHTIAFVSKTKSLSKELLHTVSI